jgi:Reverse transcriptase (RNA-dependent DNA polymerase)
MDGMEQMAETNEDKSATLATAFFPVEPAESQVPPNFRYPKRVARTFQLEEEQLRRQISRLKPHKAPGDDGIPNIVLKETVDLIAEYLLWIFQATFALQTYSKNWKAWITVILRKPGKANYDTAKSYRPIALLNTIGKLLTAIVAEDMTYMTEKYQLLPENHFGGRPGRTTTDSLHLVTNKIKGAWRRKKVAAMLFLDIEGAFPNAVTDRLLHNLRKRRIPEEYVLFVERMLADRRTKLRFDDHLSDWVKINNGIGQGDPLSMILYLFYNADLLDVPTRKGQTAVAFVDDANLYAEGDTYEEVYQSLQEMLMKFNGAKEWTQTHHSRFKKTKFAIVGFSRRRVPDPGRPGENDAGRKA